MPISLKPYWGPPWMFRAAFVLLGTVVGGIVGSLFGGEIGALFGAIIGGAIALAKSS